MRIALAQINPTIGDFSGNFQIISRFYEQAARQGVELVIFPEMATAGYPAADLLEKESFVRSAEESLQKLAERMPDLRRTGPVKRRTSSLIRGPLHLPVHAGASAAPALRS